MEILPERGGRIGSLRLGGRELLDQGIGVDLPGAAGYVEAGACGWDEMVPTVDAAVWEGVSLPDHGEAWRYPWEVVSAGGDSCVMRCSGQVLPWGLERRISLGDSVRVAYKFSNRGDVPIPGYWCSHALLRYEAGMVVDVGVELPALAEGKSGKFFLAAGSVDHATLRWRDGRAVVVAWDRRVAPYCGVWICNGDMGGYRQVAIEPATGGGDRPGSAEPAPLVAPGEAIEWWMEVRQG